MAQIDSSIALGFRPTTQIEQPVNTLARLLQAQGLQQQNQLGQMKMDEYRSGVERKNKLAALLGGQYDTEEAREDAVLRSGYLDEAQQMRKSRLDAAKAKADAGKTAADTEKVQIQTAMEKVGAIAQILQGVNSPDTYAQALQAGANIGLDVSKLPQQYDPAQVEQSKARALTVQQQLEQQWKQKGYDLDVRKQGETERNNRVQNSISQGQLNVSRGNLSLRQQELDQQKNAPKGQFIQTEQGYVLADPRTGTVQPVMGPDGKPLQGKAATKNLTEGQAKANLFGSRMLEADRILNELEGKYNPLAVNAKVAAAETPIIGGLAGWAGNAMLGESGQQAEQAQRDFINAVLRRESGAVISEPEFKNAAKQYFPQQGDSKAVLDQKRRNRQLAIKGMEAEIPGGFRSAPTLTSPGSQEPSAATGGFKIISVE
jgi:hypothetical protein